VEGELAAKIIADQLYPNRAPSTLTNDEKSNVSALSTLAADLAGGVAGNSLNAAGTGAVNGKVTVENNYLSADQGLAFDKEMQSCKASGGDCSAVVDKWKKVSDEQSATLDPKCAENPLLCQNIDKPIIEMGSEMAQRPEWIGNLPGVDVMTDEQAKIYAQYWNAQDLKKIDVNSPAWTKFVTFISDPENQAAVASLGMLGKDLVQLAKSTVTNLSQDGMPFGIKSMQVGLRNPQQVDQLKNDMLSGNYKFTAPEGRIAGYVDSKGNYYISEGNHRMVAAQEIYQKTGDASYIEKLIQNGSWTQTKNAPAGSTSMPTRK
jgi:filamentous hemagglutinin